MVASSRIASSSPGHHRKGDVQRGIGEAPSIEAGVQRALHNEAGAAGDLAMTLADTIGWRFIRNQLLKTARVMIALMTGSLRQ